jgi:hypothetical protein
MSVKTIIFEYMGYLYRVDRDVYENNLPISLPTGEVLKVSGWTKSRPLQPTGIHKIGHTSNYTPKTILAERVDSRKETMEVVIYGQTVRIPMRFYHKNLMIQLPNGSVWRVTKWYDGCPQKPFEVESVQDYEFVRATEGE